MRPAPRDGFTLVETVVALALAAVVVLTAHTGIVMLTESSTAAAAARERGLRLAAVRSQIVAWLEHTHLEGPETPWRFEGSRRTRAGQADDMLVFATLKPGQREHGPATVRLEMNYTVSGTPRGLDAVLRWPAGTGTNVRRRRLALVPEATGLEIRYRFDLAGEERWFDAWSSSVRYPAAVQLRILGSNVPALLQAPLLVKLPGN